MDIMLTLPELLTLALPGGPPPGVGTPALVAGDRTGDGPPGTGPADDVLVVDVDARTIPGLPTAARLTARAAGTVTVRVAVVEVTAGRATLDVAASARGLPAHRLVALVRGTLEDAIRGRLVARGVAGDAVRLVPDGGRLGVVVSTAELLAAAPLPAHLRGLRVTDLRLADGHVHVALALP